MAIGAFQKHSWPANPHPWAEEGYGFGIRIPPTGGASTFHQGLDIPMAYGAPIFASAEGVVVFAQYNGTAGNHVIIEHWGGKRTHYMHQISIEVSVGQSISKGQTIGYVGTTGASTGPHLHFGCEDHPGGLVDPIGFMIAYGDDRVIGAGPAGGDTSPFPPDAVPIKKERDMLVYKMNAGDLSGVYFGIAPRFLCCFVSAEAGEAEAERFGQALVGNTRAFLVAEGAMTPHLDYYGVPRDQLRRLGLSKGTIKAWFPEAIEGGTPLPPDIDALAIALAAKLPKSVTEAQLKAALSALKLSGTFTS